MEEFKPEKLRKKKVALVGVGALGTVIANHLARVGIGELRLIDRDYVEESNLQRQVLFNEEDAQRQLPKAIAAMEKLQRINPSVTLIPHVTHLQPSNAHELIAGVDLILDGTDNLETRFLINDLSIKYNIPWIYGGVIHSRGVSATIIPRVTPCFRCLFDRPHGAHGQTCDTVGVLSPIVNIVAAFQVAEALKLLTDSLTVLRKQMLQINIWNHDLDYLPIENGINPACPCCQQHKYEFLEQKIDEKLFSQLCGRDSIQITPSTKQNINLTHWQEKWANLGNTEINPFLLRLNYQNYRITLFKDGRVIIQGTTDDNVAKKMYSQLIGD